MSKIVKQDTNGVKPLLQTGELGYDNYPSGGDAGRVYVGTGSSNVALAKKSEVATVDGKVDTHVARADNPHGVTKTQVGLGNVDNTSDVNKPISTATQTALNLKANLASPALTGVPTAPTATVGTNSTVIATTAFVNAEIANDTYSKTQLDAGQLDNRYYTEAEVDSSRYTKTEVDTLLAGKVDDSEIASVNLLRADKYLASQNVVNMEYNAEGKLAKVQYDSAIDENYEVLTYNGEGKLSNVAHYIATVLKGNTVLSYTNGKLTAAPYTAI